MVEGIFVIKTCGGSMRPLLSSNEILFANKMENTLLPGDIVVYRSGNNNKYYMLHRVYFLTRQKALLCGDAGTISLHWIDREDIIGKIEGRTILCRGVLGLFYSIACCAIFTVLRYFKNKIMGIWRNW